MHLVGEVTDSEGGFYSINVQDVDMGSLGFYLALCYRDSFMRLNG